MESPRAIISTALEKMAAQDDHRLRGVLRRLRAMSMLSNVYTFPELNEAADSYDDSVNMTIREAQATLNNDEG
jgi:hypothetical protein